MTNKRIGYVKQLMSLNSQCCGWKSVSASFRTPHTSVRNLDSVSSDKRLQRQVDTRH